MLYRFFCVSLLALLVSGCAPGLGASLRVPPLPEEGVQPLVLTSGEIRVNIGKFNDMRQPQFIGDINGRLLETDGDVGYITQTGCERIFALAGAKLALFNVPSLSGDVNRWYVKVTTGFPTSKAVAEASVTMSVYDRESHKVYTATYTGQTSTEHPFLSESKIKQALGSAMNYAIRQALSDQRLLENLLAY
jgi:hypothetical protein